jgi:hypothetical protein
MTNSETSKNQPSDLTAAARDTFTDALGFMDARSKAAAAAATRRVGGPSLAAQMEVYYDETSGAQPPSAGDSPQ